MNQKKIKKLISDYTYLELGFPVILKDVTVIQERDYEYPLINHNLVMFQVAFSLVKEHHILDGARLHFIRRFMKLSLEQFAVLIGNISKSTLYNWENEQNKICNLKNEQLRAIYLELRNEIIRQIGSQMDSALIKDFSNKELVPLELEKTFMVV